MIHKRMLWGICGVVVVATVMAACGGDAAIDPLEIGDPERGEEIFTKGGSNNARACSRCHSLDGSEFRGGPTFQGIAERAGERVEGQSAVDYLVVSILSPSAYIVEGYDDTMGAGTDLQYAERLTEEDVNDLVAFLLTQ